jgi:hypothetical protein
MSAMSLSENTATARWTVACNGRTSFYEVHAAGCRHLMAAHLDIMYTAEAESGKAEQKRFNEGNEGCIAKLGPCAR